MLYFQVQTLAENTPLSSEPLPVEGLVSTKYDIEWAVWNLKNNRSGGPSGMRAKNIKGWMEESRKVEAAEMTGDLEEEGTEPER